MPAIERAAATVLFINVAVAVLVRATFDQSNVIALQFGLMAITLTSLLLGGGASARHQSEKALCDFGGKANLQCFL